MLVRRLVTQSGEIRSRLCAALCRVLRLSRSIVKLPPLCGTSRGGTCERLAAGGKPVQADVDDLSGRLAAPRSPSGGEPVQRVDDLRLRG